MRSILWEFFFSFYSGIICCFGLVWNEGLTQACMHAAGFESWSQGIGNSWHVGMPCFLCRGKKEFFIFFN